MKSETDAPSLKKRKCTSAPRYIWRKESLDTIDGDRTYYRELIREADDAREIFRVGDTIFVRSSIASRPYIGEIDYLFEDADGAHKASIRWIYRKDDVAKKDRLQLTTCIPNEVFYSDFSDENNADLILGLCKVLWVDFRQSMTAYAKLDPDAFLCRYRYLPSEAKFLPHERVCFPIVETANDDEVHIVEMSQSPVKSTGNSSSSSFTAAAAAATAAAATAAAAAASSAVVTATATVGAPTSARSPAPTVKSPARAKKVVRMCTACVEGVAEFIHPVLKVDLCGICHKAHIDSVTRSFNDIDCFWCNTDKSSTVAVCDQCQRVFCDTCIKRNFGRTTFASIVKTNPWSCFVCDQTPLAALQLVSSEPLFNMERVFSSILSPTEQHSCGGFQATASEIHAGYCPETEEVRSLLMQNPGSMKLASIFCKYMDIPALADSILPFLTSRDLAVVSAVSKGLNKLMSIMTLTPGLFETEYCFENHCKLFPHQMHDLKKMKSLENSSKEFGALRGGIFADDPGLGKTITSLALITSTAGKLPSCKFIHFLKLKFK